MKKKTPKLLALLLCVAMCLAFLTGCGDDSGTTNDDGAADGVITVANSPEDSGESAGDKTPLDAVTDFTFDCDTMSYSFTGAANAEFYYVKVFAVTDGVEEATADVQSDKIDATEENTYSGTIENETLYAGDYVAYVVASASGYASSEASVSCTSTIEQPAGGDDQQGGDQSGGGNQAAGGDTSGWEITPTDVSFAEGEASFSFVIGSQAFLETTANLQDTPNAGSTYTYTLADGDDEAPFESVMTLELKEDGTAELSVTAAGPMSDATVTGTWTSAGGTISVSW